MPAIPTAPILDALRKYLDDPTSGLSTGMRAIGECYVSALGQQSHVIPETMASVRAKTMHDATVRFAEPDYISIPTVAMHQILDAMDRAALPADFRAEVDRLARPASTDLMARIAAAVELFTLTPSDGRFHGAAHGDAWAAALKRVVANASRE